MLPEVKVEYLLLITLGQAALSLAASYIPRFREWYAAHDDVFKSLSMLIAITLVTLVVGILSFTKVWVLVPATQEGVLFLVMQWLMALMANQTTYKFSPQTDSVKVIKADVARAEIETLRIRERTESA